jgi:hypothetical protein
MVGEADSPMASPPAGMPGAAVKALASKMKGGRGAFPGHVAPSAPAQDPLSRPYKLPGGTLYYAKVAPGFDGTVFIAPTRGEQEIILAGTGDAPTAKLQALRHVMRQVCNTGALDPGELVMEDWVASSLHMLAMSAGHDQLDLRPIHPKPCGKQFEPDPPVFLTTLPCIIMRAAQPGEEVTWPPATDESVEEKVAREMELEKQGAIVERVVTPMTGDEGFVAVLGDGTRVRWRKLRMKHIEEAEEFAARVQDTEAEKPGAKLNIYLTAQHIEAINDKRVSMVQAITWAKKEPSPYLDELRFAFERMSFGYRMAPRFRCPHCGGSFRQTLPLHGGLFRRRLADAS